jgi:hypothetical protein
MSDGGSIASLVFSAFFSALSASSAVGNEWIAALPRWEGPWSVSRFPRPVN